MKKKIKELTQPKPTEILLTPDFLEELKNRSITRSTQLDEKIAEAEEELKRRRESGEDI